jgi:hypothetical protein
MDALRKAAEQEQEPVAVLLEYENGERELRFTNNGWAAKETLLYTHPPRREQDDAEIAELRAEVERLQGRVNLLEPANVEMFDALANIQPKHEELRRLLTDLTALVRGECPSLLNEDSGGDARLALAIDAALARKEPDHA